MLHDLVVLKKSLLESYDTSEAERVIDKLRTQLDNIKHQVEKIEPDNISYINDLVKYYENLLKQISAPHEDFQKKIAEIQEKISNVSHELFVNNYELEGNDLSAEYVRNHRMIDMRQDVKELIQQRIQLHTSWQYPALEIGCRDGEWTQYLIAADPLYIMDKHKEFLISADSIFVEEYRKRLRKYTLNDYNFSLLPSQQFGFVFSWGHFNYVSLDTITQVLKSVKQLLRPGGVFLFSYNDGDTPAGAGMAENFVQTYIPKSILIPTCEGLGYEVVQTFTIDPNINWIEIKKPGQLKTIKASQVIGKVERRIP